MRRIFQHSRLPLVLSRTHQIAPPPSVALDAAAAHPGARFQPWLDCGEIVIGVRAREAGACDVKPALKKLKQK